MRLRKTQISEMMRVYGSIQTEVALRVNKRGTLRKLLKKKPNSVEDTKHYFSKEKDYFFSFFEFAKHPHSFMPLHRI